MIIVATAIAATSVADQMAPARHGLWQCQGPDELFKTCLSLSKFTPAGPSNYRIETRMLLQAEGPVVAIIQAQVSVRGSEICDTMGPSDLSGATVTSADKPVSAASARRHLADLRRLYAPVFGKEICTQVVPGEQGLQRVVGRINGKRVPMADYDMKWVDPEDGWIVGN